MSIQSANNSLRNFKLGLYTSSGIWTPFDINTYAWWDASEASTITSSGGDVSQFDDKKGNGINLVQATGSNQPKTGTRTINGLNVLDFDGLFDNLKVTFGANLTQETNIYIVCQTDDTVAWQAAFSGADVTNSQSLETFGAEWNLFSGAVYVGETSDTSAHVFKCTFNGASSNISLDGVAGTPANAGTAELSGITMGEFADGGIGWNGTIAEMFIIDGALSSENDASAISYLGTKWGVSV